MGAAHDAESNLDAYVKIVLEIADADVPRAEVLARHGLREAAWDRIEDAWQAKISEATDRMGDDEGVPPLVIQYAEAFSRAQASRAEGMPIVPLEKFVEAMRLMQKTDDMAFVLKKVGLTLQEFLRANQQWTRRIVEDPELAAKFEKLMK